MGILWDRSLGDFLLVTVFLGGGAAYLTGRAVALTWRRLVYLILYLCLLTAAVRFIHYSLFQGTLLSLHYYVADLIVLLVLGGLGYRVTRARQMSGQYGWIYQRAGPVAWRRQPGGVSQAANKG